MAEAPSSKPVAVVDLGTNSCLMLVGRRTGRGELEVLADRCAVPRMGEGLDRTGEVGAPALERIREVLAGYLAEARALGAEGLRVGGTAALRRARNQAAVIAALEAPGIAVEVLGEEQEARCGWLAAQVGGAGELVGMIDVGGGSTEVAAAGGALWASAPVGATVLVERVEARRSGGGEGAFDDLVAEARGAMEAVYGTLPRGGAPWVALGGTPTNLASLVLGLDAFDHLKVEGVVCERADVERWGRELAGRDLEARCELPVEASRAPVLHGGMAALFAGMELLGVERVRVTSRGLRYGFLAECLELA